MGLVRETVQDYGENCTTHGITYIVQRNQNWCHRILWLCIVGISITFAGFLSMNAYNAWQNDPIITTVSTTALPIRDLSYPAITVCGQGMATDTLQKVLDEQFKMYLKEQGINPEELSFAERQRLKKQYQFDTYPGLSVSMSDVAAMMTAPDPGSALGAMAVGAAADAARTPNLILGLTSRPIIVIQKNRTERSVASLAAADSMSRLKGGCAYGWISSTTESSYDTVYCYKVLDDRYSYQEARKQCQKEDSIVLEFDTYGEVEDFQRLVVDGHLPVHPALQEILIGVVYSETEGYVYSFNQLRADKMLGLTAQYAEGLECARYNLTDSRLIPASCDRKATVVCTNQVEDRRRRREASDSEAEYDETWNGHAFHMARRVKRSSKAPKFDIFLNPGKKPAQQELEKKLSKKFREVFNSMNLTYSYPSIFELLWHSINPCFDIRKWTSDYRDEKSTIKRCWWKGIQVNCTAIFKTNPTDRGMCCTFNARAAEEIYRESMFARSVARLQKMNVNNSFEDANLPPGFETGEEPTPEIGKNRGLTLIVDSHANILSPGTVGDDFEGFLSVVSSPTRFPSISEKGFVIRPGHENLVAISAVDTIADDDIRSINATTRNCYFQDEYNLEMHKLYSQSGCVFECLLKFGRSLPTSDGCTPWFYPSLDTNMCDPWQTNAFVRGIFGGEASKECSYCLPDCTSTAYSSSVSATPLRRCDTKNIGLSMLCKFGEDLPHPRVWSQQVVNEYKRIYPEEDLPDFIREYEKRSARRQFIDPTKLRKEAIFEDLYGSGESLSYNAYEKDISVIHFFFEEPAVFQFRRSLRMTWIDFVGQIGGLLGLCIGFSLISGVEIIYWFTLRLSSRACCSKSPTVDHIKSVDPYHHEKEDQTNKVIHNGTSLF